MSTCNVCEGVKPKLRSEYKSVRCNKCEREFNSYVKDDWGLGEAIANRESAIGTGICADCGDPSDMDKGLCNPCRMPRHGRAEEVANPYKKVWNSVEDEEGELLARVKNGTLFVPTGEELARRYASRSRSLLAKARNQESKAAGRKIFLDAVVYRNMAEKAFEEHRKVIASSR